MLRGIVSFIEEYEPYVIFGIGWDDHADHKIASLLLDEALLVLKPRLKKAPLVFKGFAYMGTWYGPNDYFDPIPKETLPVIREQRESCRPYAWDERMVVYNDPKDYGLRWWKSRLFKAYKSYKTADGSIRFFRCANTDKCFWFHDLSDLATQASIEAVHPNKECLNDGKIIDSANVRYGEEMEKLRSYRINSLAQKESIRLNFKNEISISRGTLYFSGQSSMIMRVEINGGIMSFEVTPPMTKFNIEPSKTNSAIFHFETNGKDFFINEIELYNDDKLLEQANEFIQSIQPKKSFSKKKRALAKAFCYLRKISFKTRSFLINVLRHLAIIR